MKKQLKHISVHQSSKLIAVMAFFLLAIIFWGIALVRLVSGVSLVDLPEEQIQSGSVFIALFIAPFIYGLVTYVMYLIGFAFYNFTANLVGGIEVEVENQE